MVRLGHRGGGCLHHRARRLRGPRAGCGGARDGRAAEALDQRRHVGCALREGLLPGARIRPHQRDDPPDRRAHRRSTNCAPRRASTPASSRITSRRNCSRRAADRGRRAAPPARRPRGRPHRARASCHAALHLPSPTSRSEPTMERTWLCRKERASARISISSP